MIRLQKLLAGAGLGSRRTVEEWIRAGRLTVGGRMAQLGDRARPHDDMRLDGRKLELGSQGLRRANYSFITSPSARSPPASDPRARPTVFERLPPPRSGRWINVGRLDVNTSGVLLLTTDGELAHRLMHPSSEVEREYLVRLRGRAGREVLEQLLAECRSRTARPGSTGWNRRMRRPGAMPATALSGSCCTKGATGRCGGCGTRSDSRSAACFAIRYGPIELPRDMRPGELSGHHGRRLRTADRAAGLGVRRQPGRGRGRAPLVRGVRLCDPGARSQANNGPMMH